MCRRNKSAIVLLAFALTICLAGCCANIPAPENITVKLESDCTALVSWDAVDGADSYRVFRKSGQAADYQYLCDVEESSYQDSGLIQGEVYSYKVKTLMENKLSDAAESAPVKLPESPAITNIQIQDSTHLLVDWKDTGAEKYRLYAAGPAGAWTLVLETTESQCVLSPFSDYGQLRVSSVYGAETGGYETPCSAAEPLLTVSSRITSVTQMDRYTAVIQYDAVKNTEAYRIYRCETPTGTYTLSGTSRDNVYYDEIEDGKTYFYKVQPVTERMEGPLSEAVQLGTNAKDISGVAVFMYHDFVDQADLDAGVAFDEYAIWTEEFEQDLQYLKSHGYTTITSSQLADYLKGHGKLPDKAVMLTIDDGKLGVYKHAYPLLQKYGMKAVLAVIGESIDAAEADPQARASDPAPYCTWEEIKEMSDSGAIEIASHSYTRHRYQNDGYTGADIKSGESADAFYQTALMDYERMDWKLREVTGKGTVTLSYPYSKRSTASDMVWIRCGYEILFCGDNHNVRHSQLNYYIQDAGINYYSARTRRLPRMTGTPLQTYLEHAVSIDDWPLS